MSGFTQAQIDALRAAIASGVLTVETQGRRVTYQNVTEMRNLLAIMEGQLSTSRTNSRVVSVNKGL